MRIEEVRAVLEISVCSQGRASVEQIHKLILLAARIKRLRPYGTAKLSDRQERAVLRAYTEAVAIGHAIGATRVVSRATEGVPLVLYWSHCSPTEL